MKNILFLLLILPSILIANNRPDYAVALIDSSLTSEANAVIRSYNSVFDVKAIDDATHKVKMVVTRLNKAARYEYAVVHYDQYTKVNSISATIYDAYGKEIRKFKKSDIVDQSAISGFSIYEDDRVKYIDLSYGEYPYTVEYEYELTTKNTAIYPSWDVQNFRTSVEHSTYQLIVPEEIEIHSQFFNLERSTHKMEEMNERTKQVWQIEDVLAVKYERGIPERNKRLANALFVPNKFMAGGYQGDMSSWEAYGKFMYELNKGRDILSESMQEEVTNMTKDLATEEEKIAVLYRYLQDNMRYVSVQLGIGGWQTFDALYVEENKFGDCKALSNFMQAMLKAIDIPAYSTLVLADDEAPYHVNEEFSMPMFNHVILHVPSSETWLECTSNYSPPNYLGTSTADRNVLLITEEGGKLVRTPKADASINWKKTKTNIQIDSKGAAQINRELHTSGLFQDWYRGAKEVLSQEELEKRLLTGSSLPMSEIENLKIETQRDVPEANITYDLEVTRYASKSGKRLFIPINSINTFDDLPPKAKQERTHPYAVKYGYLEQDTIVFQLPAQAKVESLPKDVSLDSDYGSFQMTYTMSEKQLICVRRLEVKTPEVPAEEYNSYRDFFKQVIKKDKSKLVVVISQV